MCDVCSGLLSLFESHDDRLHSGGGLRLGKNEILSVIQYVNVWPQKQCMCCYKEFKNFERFNNIVQIMLTVAIRHIQTLPEDYAKEKKEQSEKDHEDDAALENSDNKDKVSSEGSKPEEVDKNEAEEEHEETDEVWTMEERDQLFQLVTKVFLMNFPSYVAYKHVVHSSLEELSQQETRALNNYCEISDSEVPLYLLRNVCFFCDSNGVQALQQCFEKATPDTLPFTVAHTLINIIANLRLWMNIATVMQCIVPLRTAVIRYMCKLSDKDLRMAGTRNMTDLMWAAVKEPLDTHFTYDKEGLDLAFKYFTCSTLTIRLAGIAQINRQIDLYNECCNNDTLVDAENVGNLLAKWLLENKIIEHIFGPNLHVEIIKQSQIILNILAVEGKITNEHIDCIWAASQLKHCSKQVYDILIPRIKNLDLLLVQHLSKLVSSLDPSAHTESTLYLASALLKCIWSTCATSQSHVAAVHHQQPPDQPQAIGPVLEQDDEDIEHGKAGKPDMSSSESLQLSEVETDKVADTHTGKRVGLADVKNDQSPTDDPQKDSSKNDSKTASSRQQPNVPSKKHGSDHRQKAPRKGSQQFPGNSENSDESDLEDSTQLSNLAKEFVPPSQVGGGSSGSESDVECSESSAGEGQICAALKHGIQKRRGVKRQPVPLKCQPRTPRNRNSQAYRDTGQGTCSDEDEDDEEEEEEEEEDEEEEEEVEEEEEEEEMESEYEESDEDMLKHDKMVHVKHPCHGESEDSSDFDANESRQAKLMHGAKLHYESQHGLQEHRVQQQQQGLLKQACLVFQRQGKKHYRIRPGLQRSENGGRLQQGIRAGAVSLEARDDSDGITASHCKELEVGAEGDKKMTISDAGNLSQDSQDSHDSEARPSTSANHDSADSSIQGVASSQSAQEFENRGDEAEMFDCANYIQHIQAHPHGHIQSDYIEDILSPEGSCHSSRMSTKSEKNMADFDGEEVLSDEELAQINAHPHFNAHQMQQHLASMASMYHTHMPHVIHPRPSQKEVSVSSCTNFTFDDVCKKGNTLLWDLVQDDTACLLPDGLVVEAEKDLYTLVCYSPDRRIKIKFIEACIENVAAHKSVVVSLRLLPKIFSSFPQYRSGSDNHAVTMWAEKELNMMSHFFNDLIHYTENHKSGQKSHSLYSHKEQIKVRLQFLTGVFSAPGSPETFRLSLEQVDTLWACLATDPECSDECLSWFLNQAKSKEHHHAMCLDTFKHIFLEKMPQLKPESMSMIGLNLFQQLSHLARIANASLDTPLSEDQVCGMDQLWQIALRALNTDVSITAIQFLNNYYINYGNGLLEKEEEFIWRCMDSLLTASQNVEENPDMNLLVIQRGLILLKNHLEGFRKRYAYHLRNWHIDGRGIVSHLRNVQEKQSTPIRILLQPAGISEKTPLDMLSTDLIAELRAEVARWWEALQKQQQLQRQQSSGNHGNSMLSPILGAMLGDGPIRMITLGQELTVDNDEKTLSEMQFKDLQLVFVSVGASRPQRKMDGTLPSSCLPSPSPERLPMMILLQDPNFERLLTLLEQLSNLSFQTADLESKERWNLQSKAKIFSRRVWELLMLLPTSPEMLDGFKSIMPSTPSEQNEQLDDKIDWSRLLDPQRPHRLMYSLQIVESLSKNPRSKKKSVSQSSGCDTDSEMSVEGQEMPEEIWTKQFVSKGGLSHLVNIFKSGTLQAKGGETWNQWNQECLAYLLRLISQFSVERSDAEAGHDDVFENYEIPRKKMKRQKSNCDKIVVPRLNQTIMSMLNVSTDLQIIMQILFDAAIPIETNLCNTGTWGRPEVVHYALNFLVSWAYSCEELKNEFCMTPNFNTWLKRLTLEAPEPCVRKEVCTGLYQLCLGKTSENRSGYAFLLPILSSMLSFLHEALLIKPQLNDAYLQEEKKETYGPGCRDYFWLVCRFVDNISRDDASHNSDSPVNLDTLCKEVANHIISRSFYETRHGYEEDDAVIGLLNLCTANLKHDPPFKTSEKGRVFLEDIFWCLFALPSPSNRNLPKCKSQASRAAAYDLLVEMVKGSVDNYTILHEKMMKQHSKDSHAPYPWDYWPHEDGRSKCGYVGLTNLGATCYMATCMQHLYMIPQARQSVLQAKCTDQTKHESTLIELQKIFAYLQESERKAYNPKSFCKTYTMDKQPLNTGEQKDMTEFFTDLITKLEEMSTDMKKLVKSLFGGVLTNNVVSLDCPHVSRTVEEFYTVRCQVTDMKNLYDSLDEVTVKDMLEGDNMYTCSKCQKKVRAEKRACFRKLPKILCFNTMRYTFNMVTMMKEKVNTHFSFPLRLDMSQYMEVNLMGPDKLQDDDEKNGSNFTEDSESECYEYELIGVTVHTGTADGGHYYSFIRDRINQSKTGQDKWYLFNDAEVKPFDPSQIAAECFGGEMTSKTYDSVTDKFMDFSFEKTNSAYMLFYERCSPKKKEVPIDEEDHASDPPQKFNFDLSKELADWIWQDNMQFLQDKNIFEHTYFGFMLQLCGYIQTTLPRDDPRKVPLMAAQLSASFVLETHIHAKEKPTMLQWIELLTKQFNSCQAACEWFLEHMSECDWWPQQILIKCPNQMVRQMFQRLLVHVITQLKSVRYDLLPSVNGAEEVVDSNSLSNRTCATKFIKRMLSILEHGVRPHSKHLTEYFSFLLEFAKMGDEECFFLININAISTIVNFYMGQKAQENYVEILSDDEEEDDVIAMPEDKHRPLALDKMIALIAQLVERSRGEDNQLRLSEKDYNSIIGGKNFPFLYNQIKDHINVRQTCNLIFSLCRWNDSLATAIVQMLFNAVKKLNAEQAQPFFKLMSYLVEFIGGPPGMPPFMQYILQRFWELTECCPHQCLEWLSTQVTRNKIANAWVLQQMDNWVEAHLIAHNNVRVRNAASFLLVSLVPNLNFRQAFRTARSILSPHKELLLSADALAVLHQIYEHLLSLLSRARLYVDPQTHGTSKLVCYFAVMTYCLISKKEKLMFGRYFADLWQLFQPKLSEPQISMHHNKQAMLLFWYQVCVDCPDNVKLIVTNPPVCKNIAFNYILADHDDQEVVMFNRCMLPAYYGLLRICCLQSRSFTRQLAQHQNILWAFKNISPYPAQYTAAVEELFKMMRVMAMKHPDSTEEELKAINNFRRTTIQMYLQHLDARSGWQTLINSFKILVDSTDDRLLIIYQQGLQMITEAFFTLHVMYHEATACHVTGDIVDLMTLLLPVLKVARHYLERKNPTTLHVKECIFNWNERAEFVRKLLTLLNSYTPPEIRQSCFEVLKEMVLTFQKDIILTIVTILRDSHKAFQDSNLVVSMGPYFPRRGQKPICSKSNVRPPRPQFQMFLLSNQLEATRGVDEAYDAALSDFFTPYHLFIDLLCRVAVNQHNLTKDLINLSAMVAYEGVPLHSLYFAKLWNEIYHLEQFDKSCIKLLCNSYYFIEYVNAVLLDERMSLNSPIIYQFFCNFFPKVHQQVLNDPGQSLLDSLVASITAEKSATENVKTDQELFAICQRINGDLRAMLLIFSVQPPKQLSNLLTDSLQHIHKVCCEYQQRQRAEMGNNACDDPPCSPSSSSSIASTPAASSSSGTTTTTTTNTTNTLTTTTSTTTTTASTTSSMDSTSTTTATPISTTSLTTTTTSPESPVNTPALSADIAMVTDSELAEDQAPSPASPEKLASSSEQVGPTEVEDSLETPSKRRRLSENEMVDTVNNDDASTGFQMSTVSPTSDSGDCGNEAGGPSSGGSSSSSNMLSSNETKEHQELSKCTQQSPSRDLAPDVTASASTSPSSATTTASNSTAGTSTTISRSIHREKPNFIDTVIKHIEHLYGFLGRK